MKKILITFLVLVLYVGANAQCVPDTINYSSPGTYPSVPPGLPDAVVGQPYGGVITAIIPIDTVILGVTIPVDSIGFTSYDGLPAGFTVTPNNATSFWPGGSAGCVLISGTATSGQVGSYPLVFHVSAHGGGFTFVDSITKFTLEIVNQIGIDDNEKDDFYVMQNNPNPFEYNTVIQFNIPEYDDVRLSVFNMLGEMVRSEYISAHPGLNKYRFYSNDLEAGVYIYRLERGNSYITRRMIISK